MKQLEKMIVVFAIAAALFGMSGCGIVFPWTEVKIENSVKNTLPVETTQLPTQQETEPANIPEITLQELLEQLEGIWIFDDSIDFMYEGQYSCEVLQFTEGYYYTAVYPGGYDRGAKVDSFQQVGENEYVLNLHYEAGEYMGDYVEEAYAVVTITLQDNGTLAAKYSQGSIFTLIYGGATFEEVNATCQTYMGN